MTLMLNVVNILNNGRFDTMDKSTSGWIMHTYGEHILNTAASTSPNSLLLSHTGNRPCC